MLAPTIFWKREFTTRKKAAQAPSLIQSDSHSSTEKDVSCQGTWRIVTRSLGSLHHPRWQKGLLCSVSLLKPSKIHQDPCASSKSDSTFLNGLCSDIGPWEGSMCMYINLFLTIFQLIRTKTFAGCRWEAQDLAQGLVCLRFAPHITCFSWFLYHSSCKERQPRPSSFLWVVSPPTPPPRWHSSEVQKNAKRQHAIFLAHKALLVGLDLHFHASCSYFEVLCQHFSKYGHLSDAVLPLENSWWREWSKLRWNLGFVWYCAHLCSPHRMCVSRSLW